MVSSRRAESRADAKRKAVLRATEARVSSAEEWENATMGLAGNPGPGKSKGGDLR